MGRPATTNGVAKNPVYRRPQKDTSEISPFIKYLLFGFNVLLWVSGKIKSDQICCCQTHNLKIKN